jgi:hypothetical protein
VRAKHSLPIDAERSVGAPRDTATQGQIVREIVKVTACFFVLKKRYSPAHFEAFAEQLTILSPPEDSAPKLS